MSDVNNHLLNYSQFCRMPIWPRLHQIVLLGPGLADFWLDLLMHLLSHLMGQWDWLIYIGFHWEV